MNNSLVLILYFTLALINSVMAQDHSGNQEFLFDLDFENDIDPEPSQSNVNRSAFRFTIDHELSSNPSDYTNLVNNRSGVQIEFDKLITSNVYAKLDAIGNLYWPDDHISEDSKKSTKYLSRFKEAWLQRSWESLYLKIGIQNIVWSEVDSSRATDTINAIDNSELLFIDFEDARLGQWMLSSQYYKEDISWEGFINIIPKFNKLPVSNSIYNPLPALPATPAEQPDPEAGIRAQTKLGAAEIALLVANLAPNQPAFDFQTGQQIAKRFWLSGINFNYARGKFLWKADVGYKTDQANYALQSLVHKDVIDIALGVEFIEQQNIINFSVTRNIISNWQSNLLLQRQTGLYLLSWSKAFLNEDLAISVSYGKLYNEASQYAFVNADYVIDDHVSFIASLFWFEINKSNTLLSSLNDNNRISLKIKYQM